VKNKKIKLYEEISPKLKSNQLLHKNEAKTFKYIKNTIGNFMT